MKSKKNILLLIIFISFVGCNPVSIKPKTIHFNPEENLKTFEVFYGNTTNSKVALAIFPSKPWLEVTPNEVIIEKGDSITVQVYLNSLYSHTKSAYTEFIATNNNVSLSEYQSFDKDTEIDVPTDNFSPEIEGSTDLLSNPSTNNFPLEIGVSTDLPSTSTTNANTILNSISQLVLTLQNLLNLQNLQSKNPYPDFATANIYIKSFFTTKTVLITTTPNYFTEDFTGDIDLAYKSLAFVPDESMNFYKLETKNITQFPNPTDNANIINFASPEEPFKLQITDGKKVLYYGKSYDTLYISGYGWIGFGKPKKNSKPQYTELSKELPYYFYSPQISIFPTNQSNGVEVISYLQFQNKLVISYENTSTYQNEQGETKNSFQIELFYNGKININYLSLDSTARGIIGLSFGTGKQVIPPGFMESDFVPSSN